MARVERLTRQGDSRRATALMSATGTPRSVTYVARGLGWVMGGSSALGDPSDMLTTIAAEDAFDAEPALQSRLTEDQLEIYNMTLADKAYVQEEKAVNAYKLALDKSFELTLYNENTAFATRQLGELRPDDYPGLTEQLLDPRYTSSKSGQKYSFETSL